MFPNSYNRSQSIHHDDLKSVAQKAVEALRYVLISIIFPNNVNYVLVFVEMNMELSSKVVLLPLQFIQRLVQAAIGPMKNLVSSTVLP